LGRISELGAKGEKKKRREEGKVATHSDFRKKKGRRLSSAPAAVGNKKAHFSDHKKKVMGRAIPL